MSSSSKFVLGLLAAAAFAAAAPAAHAAVVTIDTHSAGGDPDGANGYAVYTVNDPDFGPYTVTVTGYGTNKQAGDSNWYFRDNSLSGEDDTTIHWTISGLNPAATISAFSLGTTKIPPSVGSGSTWNYLVTFSGDDLASASTLSVAHTYASTANSQPFALGDASTNFGNAPVFNLAIDEQDPFGKRTIGTYDFTISAVSAAATPEPASLSLLALGGAALLSRRRRNA